MEVVRVAINPLDGVCYSGYKKSPVTDEETWSGPPGSGVIMTQDLAHRTNLTIEWIFANNIWGNAPKTRNPDDPPNTGIIGKLHFDRADWSPCSITRTLMRSKVVLYSDTPLIISELLMATRTTSSSHQVLIADSVLQPFDSLTWYAVCLSLFLYGVLFGSVNFLGIHHNFTSPVRFLRHVAIYWIDLSCNLLTIGNPTTEIYGYGPGRVIFLLWCIPAYFLGELYGGELIAYLSSVSHVTMITSWDQLFSALRSGQHRAVARHSSWVVAEGYHLFGAEVEAKIEWLDNYDDCFNRMISDMSGATVWMDTGEDVATLLRINHIKPPEEVYVMGDGLALGVGFVGMCYNPRRVDLKKRFDPWIERYSETGHITHWDQVSERELLVYYQDRKKDHTEVKKHETEALAIEDMVGHFTCYVLVGLLGVLFLLLELFQKKLCYGSASSHPC